MVLAGLGIGSSGLGFRGFIRAKSVQTKGGSGLSALQSLLKAGMNGVLESLAPQERLYTVEPLLQSAPA